MSRHGVPRALAAAALLLAATIPNTAGDLPAHILNLARIERAMADQLKRLPNYTCLETIDRYTGRSGSKMKPWDRVRLNVAIVDGRELYALPGARSFDDRSLAEQVSKGFIADGDFATMARNVFLNRVARITFAGEESLSGRALLRYDFAIPQMLSGWQLHVRNATGILGATGSFWTDAGTLELVRLRYAAEDLPLWSPDISLDEDVAYQRVQIGGAGVLLPATVDARAQTFDGQSHWNHTTFTQCRQYGSESVISFEEEPRQK